MPLKARTGQTGRGAIVETHSALAGGYLLPLAQSKQWNSIGEAPQRQQADKSNKYGDLPFSREAMAKVQPLD